MLASSAGILERSCSFSEVGKKLFAMVGAGEEKASKKHPPVITLRQ